ncbi:hypothetical protein D3C78_1710880 [compost metagenome]
MFVLHIVGAVGGGDVKLFAGIGAWMGMWLTLTIMMYSILAAGCLGILVLIWRQEMFRRMRRILFGIFGGIVTKSWGPIESSANKQLQMPFMLAVLPGAIMAITYF